MSATRLVVGLLILAISCNLPVYAQDDAAKVAEKLQGFDAYMEKVLKDWNAPGHWRRHRGERQTRVRERLWLPRL